jgi:hypothetical protein
VLLQPAWRAGYAVWVGRPLSADRPSARLMSFDRTLRTMAIYPLRTFPGSNFLKRKHPPFAEIVLEGWDRPLPETPEDVMSELRELPAGFVRDPNYGLGLEKEFEPILQAIGRIRGISALVLRHAGEKGVSGERFCMTYDDFDNVRRAMHRVTLRYRAEAKVDRVILAHNEILTALDPKRFPETKRIYGPGTVFKLLERRSAASPLSRDDGRALVKTLAGAASTFAKDPEELFALGEAIEKVSLEVVIGKFEAQMSRGGTELQWQRLLDENPFILSLVFGYPIVQLASQGTVGGWHLKGGAKIADYVVKNQLTHAIALVELKTPDTPLLAREYRKGVLDVSPKLSGAVMQILDQRLKLQKSLSLIKDEEEDEKVRSAEIYGIDIILIAGRTPTEKKAIKSFELFRGSLKDVRIFTFDELLQKMKTLLDLLTPPKVPAAVSDDNLQF